MPDDLTQRALAADLDLTRALLRQARADRDRLQAEASASGSRVVELEQIALAAIARAEAAETGVHRLVRRLRGVTRTLRRDPSRSSAAPGAPAAPATGSPGPVASPANAAASASPAVASPAVTSDSAAVTSGGPDPTPAAPATQPGTTAPLTTVFLDATALRDPARSGIARVTIRLAQELAQFAEVRLVTMRDGSLLADRSFDAEVFGRPAPAPDPAAVPITGAPGAWLLSPCLQLAAELDAWSAEVARFQAGGGRYAQVVHDLLPIRLPDFFDGGMRGYFPRWLAAALARADVVFTDSRATAADLVAWAGPAALRHPPRVLPLGSDLTVSAGAAPDPTGPARLLAVGVVEPRKSVDVILTAVRSLRTAGHDVELALVGRRGWADPALIAELDGLRTSAGWFTWDEAIPDAALLDHYRGSHLLVAASRGEGYGLPLAEARACGLPVLARDLPVFREVLGDDGSYFTVDADLPDAILAALGAPRAPARATTTWATTAATVAAALRER